MSRTDRRTTPGLILAATIAAAMLVVANVSSLNVALPQLSRELDASQTDVQWMIDIYAVFLAALLLPAGALGDRYGRRRMLLFGIVVLAGANAATLLVETATPVIVLRGVSGVGAAFVFPATLSTITATLPHHQRGRGVAMWTAAVGIGGIVGIVGSGVLIENFWWGSIFFAMTIAALLVLALCWLFVPDSSDPAEANLDPVGAVLSFAAAGALVLGVIEGPVKGWMSPLAAGAIVVGVVTLIGFVAWEWRNPRPLLDVRLFAERGIRSGSLSIFVQFTAAFGFFFLTVPYLAFVLDYGPLKTGLGLLPVAIGLFPASAVAIPLTRRFGRRTMGVLGLLVLASAFVVGTLITVESSFVLFAAVMVIFGLGLGLSSPPATEAIVEALPPAKQGVASALNDVLREFGAAIGIAAIGSAFNAGYRTTIDDLVGFPDQITEAVRETPAAAAVIAPDLGDAGPTLLAGVADAVLHGWERGLWLTAIIVATGAAGYALWAPRKQPATPESAAVAPAHRSEPILLHAAAGMSPEPSPRLDLGGIDSSGPLGAIEIAGAAEADLARLEKVYRDLETTHRAPRCALCGSTRHAHLVGDPADDRRRAGGARHGRPTVGADRCLRAGAGTDDQLRQPRDRRPRRAPPCRTTRPSAGRGRRPCRPCHHGRPCSDRCTRGVDRPLRRAGDPAIDPPPDSRRATPGQPASRPSASRECELARRRQPVPAGVGQHRIAPPDRADGRPDLVRARAVSNGPVVVGLDGSEHSWSALAVARRLADALEVELVAAYAPHHAAVTEFSVGALAAEHATESSIEAAIRSRLTATDPTVELRRVGDGQPGQELSELADAIGAQMIVVATRGRGLVRSAVLGSVAHHLVTHAAVPVLVVR